jgi:hypothetical protein
MFPANCGIILKMHEDVPCSCKHPISNRLFDMQFGLLNGEREVIGLYPEFTLQKRKCTPTEGEKNCKLPQEETQQINNTHHQTQWQILMTTNMDQIQ